MERNGQKVENEERGGHDERGILSVGKKMCTRTGQEGRGERRIPRTTNRVNEKGAVKGTQEGKREKCVSGVKCKESCPLKKKMNIESSLARHKQRSIFLPKTLV